MHEPGAANGLAAHTVSCHSRCSAMPPSTPCLNEYALVCDLVAKHNSRVQARHQSIWCCVRGSRAAQSGFRSLLCQRTLEGHAAVPDLSLARHPPPESWTPCTPQHATPAYVCRCRLHIGPQRWRAPLLLGPRRPRNARRRTCCAADDGQGQPGGGGQVSCAALMMGDAPHASKSAKGALFVLQTTPKLTCCPP